jgi:hypothetical protein
LTGWEVLVEGLGRILSLSLRSVRDEFSDGGYDNSGGSKHAYEGKCVGHLISWSLQYADYCHREDWSGAHERNHCEPEPGACGTERSKLERQERAQRAS